MAAMLIETETTPNPATLKFLPGRAVIESGPPRDFADAEEAEASPFAEALFGLGDVAGVFYGRDFIAVTAGEGADWRDLKPQVLSILLDVDNGPDGLIHLANDRLYGKEGLRAAHAALRPGGVLAIWSAYPDKAFTDRLARAGFRVDEVKVRATGGRKGAHHVIWLAIRG